MSGEAMHEALALHEGLARVLARAEMYSRHPILVPRPARGRRHERWHCPLIGSGTKSAFMPIRVSQ